MKSANDSMSPYEQGMAHLKQSEYERAVEAFTEAIRLNPKRPNAYAGRALAYRSLEEEESALRDEQTVRDLGGVKPVTGEHIMLLTSDVDIAQRMEQPEQFAEYVKSVVDGIKQYFEQFPPECGLDLQVACAVLPRDQLLLEISVRPHEQSETVTTGLQQHLETLPRPKVKYGPIAFSSQSVVQNGCSQEQERFGFPFASLMKQGYGGTLDHLLMAAGGQSAGQRSWWGKIKRVLGFGQ